jgi:hypothetical protein
MDMSGSITDPNESKPQNWNDMKSFVNGIINFFPVGSSNGAQISLLTFNDKYVQHQIFFL